MAMKTESVAKTERPDNSSIENVAMFMSSGGRSGHEVQVIQKHTCMLGMVLLESNLNSRNIRCVFEGVSVKSGKTGFCYFYRCSRRTF